MGEQDQNSSVWNNKIGNLMFGKIRQKYLCLEGWDNNFNVWKDNIANRMFGKIRQVL